MSSILRLAMAMHGCWTRVCRDSLDQNDSRWTRATFCGGRMGVDESTWTDDRTRTILKFMSNDEVRLHRVCGQPIGPEAKCPALHLMASSLQAKIHAFAAHEDARQGIGTEYRDKPYGVPKTLGAIRWHPIAVRARCEPSHQTLSGLCGTARSSGDNHQGVYFIMPPRSPKHHTVRAHQTDQPFVAPMPSRCTYKSCLHRGNDIPLSKYNQLDPMKPPDQNPRDTNTGWRTLQTTGLTWAREQKNERPMVRRSARSGEVGCVGAPRRSLLRRRNRSGCLLQAIRLARPRYRRRACSHLPDCS